MNETWRLRLRARERLNLPPVDVTTDTDMADRDRWTLKLERILMNNVIWPQALADELYALLDDLKGRTP